MTKWFAYFKEKGKLPHFRLIVAESLTIAEMMVGELATRDKIKCIGIIGAPKFFQ